MNNDKKLTIYPEVLEAVLTAAPRIRPRLALGVFQYLNGQEVKSDHESGFTMNLIIALMDVRKRQSERNSLNGSKGGAPKGNKNALSKQPKTSDKQPRNKRKTTEKQAENKQETSDGLILGCFSVDSQEEKERTKEREEYIYKKTPSYEGAKKGAEAPHTPARENPEEQSEAYTRFLAWVKDNAPYCAEHLKQPTEKEFFKLKEKFTTPGIMELISQIENRKDKRKNYTNLYRTILNWGR